MCNEARMEVIYLESRDNYTPGYFDDEQDWHDGKTTGEVLVILSFWHSPDWQTSDHFVVEEKVTVDEKEEVYVIKAYRPEVYDRPAMIRLALKTFEKLCAAHPDPKINGRG